MFKMGEDMIGMNIGKAIKRNVPIFCALTLIATEVCVASLVWTCPVCKTEFKFPSNASTYKNSFAQKHLAVCRPTGSAGGFSYGGGTGDPVFDAMMPMFNSLFQQAGKSMADELFGNPEQQRQQAELRRVEQQRLQELERRRREEMARMRKELHEKLLSELMLLDTTGNLSLITLSGDADLVLDSGDQKEDDETLELMGMDDGLRPAGTSFFGLGGGDDASEGDEGEVSLRNLRRAAYLVQKAQSASTTEAEFLIDEGLRTATGQPSFGAIDDQAIPVVSEEGLLAFQKANNDYRRARDFHMETSERFARDNAQCERARVLYEKAKQELEQQAGPEGVDPEQQQTMSKLYNRLKELHETRLQTKVTLESAENDMLWTDFRRRTALEDTISEPSAVADILERERQYLKPSIVDRLAHARRTNTAEVYAREFDQYLQENYGFVEAPGLNERVKGLTERVKALSPYPDEPTHVRIIDRPRDLDEPGSFEHGVWSTSDTIYYGIEYLEGQPSDDEILFVAGHEIAHVQRDHYIKYIGVREDVAENVAPETLIDWEKSTLSDEDKLKIRDAAYNAALQDLNHEQEFEADRLGAFMALSAGAKPNAFREVFGNGKPSASDNEKNPPDRKLRELTSTHPRGYIRLEKLREIYGTAIDKAPTKTEKETNK